MGAALITSREEICRLITGQTPGIEMEVVFIKRSTGEKRLMKCLYGVKPAEKSAKGPAYSATAKGLIVVWDTEKKEYRAIPQEGILSLKIGNSTYQIVDEMAV